MFTLIRLFILLVSFTYFIACISSFISGNYNTQYDMESG